MAAGRVGSPRPLRVAVEPPDWARQSIARPLIFNYKLKIAAQRWSAAADAVLWGIDAVGRRCASLLFLAGAALALAAGPTGAQPTSAAEIVEPSPVLAPAALAAVGASAEDDCRARLDARCLAEIALARIAAGQRGARPIAPYQASALVVRALSNGGHGATLRALTFTAEAVRRIPVRGQAAAGAWDNGTLLRTGRIGEVRLAMERIEDPVRRAVALLSLARSTHDPIAIAASLAAADALPPGEGRRIALAWTRALALGTAGDRAGMAAWLDALAQGPDFTEETNGDPALGQITVSSGENDTFRGRGGIYAGERNLPRLAAHAWAALGDGPRALASAGDVRWPPARLWALDAVARHRPVLRSSADARIVSLPEGHADARSFRAGVQRALFRLNSLGRLERMLTKAKGEAERHQDLDDDAEIPRLLASGYARVGDSEAAERVAVWTGEAALELAKANAGRDGPTREEIRDAGRLVARVRLAAALAKPTGHERARALLSEEAPPAAVEACVAEGSAECHALAVLLQAITDIP